MTKRDQKALITISGIILIAIYSAVKAVIDYFYSLSTESYIYIGIASVLACSAGLLFANKRKQRLQKLKAEEFSFDQTVLAQVKNIIYKHKDELTLRRRQLTLIKNYGLIDESKWAQEKDTFINAVIAPDVGKLSYSNLSEALEYMDSITDHYSQSIENFNAEMSPNEYEHWVASALMKYGWNTKVTQAVGDQGIDVIATQSEVKLVIQCKLYSGNVGNAAVQEITAGRLFENANFAAVVTNSTFTKSAKQLASASGVFLLHHDQLKDLTSLCGLSS
jgi:restriction system protein